VHLEPRSERSIVLEPYRGRRPTDDPGVSQTDVIAASARATGIRRGAAGPAYRALAAIGGGGHD
jgi:hypothetical protein